jgi:hypothetical protein
LKILKGVFRSRQSEKDRQYNGQRNKDKMTITYKILHSEYKTSIHLNSSINIIKQKGYYSFMDRKQILWHSEKYLWTAGVSKHISWLCKCSLNSCCYTTVHPARHKAAYLLKSDTMQAILCKTWSKNTIRSF